MNTKDKIKAYLGDGLKPSQITSLVGCSPAYISQLLKDEDFKNDVLALQQNSTRTDDEKLGTKYEALEHSIISEMMNAVGGQELPVLARALDSVVKAQDMKAARKNPIPQGATSFVNIVSLTLPAHALQRDIPVITTNEIGEVIAIDDKPMAPMSSDGVKGLFAKMLAAKAVATQPMALTSDF